MLRRFAEMFSDVSPIVIQLVLDIAGPGCFALVLTVCEPITQAQTKTEQQDTGTDENSRTH
jgi:hypothetical protein